MSNLATDPMVAGVDFSGLQRAVDEAGWKMDELRGLLKEALPYLRDGVRRCENCQGAGVEVHGTSDEDAYETTCSGCKDLQDLIERVEPRLPKPSPSPEPDEEDGIDF